MPTNFFANLDLGSSSSGDYVKIQPDTRVTLRILGNPISGYFLFQNGKPIRAEDKAGVPMQNEKGEKRKIFMQAIVYQYGQNGEAGGVKIWDVTSKDILRDLIEIFESDDLHPGNVKLNVKRDNSGLKTKYTTRSTPSPMEENLKAFAQVAHEYINLDAVYTGEGQFLKDLPNLEADTKPKEAKADDLPF